MSLACADALPAEIGNQLALTSEISSPMGAVTTAKDKNFASDNLAGGTLAQRNKRA